jgi:hypothetical protein
MLLRHKIEFGRANFRFAFFCAGNFDFHGQQRLGMRYTIMYDPGERRTRDRNSFTRQPSATGYNSLRGSREGGQRCLNSFCALC